jgi:hypothetical protein
VVAHLLPVPAGADPELEAAAGEAVEGGDLFRGDDRVALDDEADAAADPQPRGRRGGGGERAKRSWVWLYLRGSSPPAGYGVSRPTGMCVCSAKKSDSWPRSSTMRASSPGSTASPVGK